jgi:hypothetical protein
VADGLEILATASGFDWDEHNADKIRERHGVLPFECEEVFASGPLVAPDPRHSAGEPRHAAFGSTRTGRRLAIFFTVRAGRIRVIGARDPSRRERRELQHAEKAQEDSALP